jgi:hypothetical protein
MAILFKREVIEEIIPETINESIFLKIKGKFFVFDEESKKDYDQFNNDLFNIVIINGYLARELKCGGKITFFHEWLMRAEVEKFKENNNLSEHLQIHHTTFCKRINIRRYLKIITKEQHKRLHGGSYGGLKYVYDDNDIESEYL